MATIKMNELRLPIDGLAGEACARRVEHALGAVAGVSSVLVDAVNGFVTIVYDPARTGLARFASTVDAAGCGTALPNRAVRRLRVKSDGTGHDRATRTPLGRTSPRGVRPTVDECAEAEILQQLIGSAFERVGVPASGCCSEHAASPGTTDRGV